MTDRTAMRPTRAERHGWIRLRTTITLRWAAIIGQIVAILVAQHGFNLKLELGLCYFVIGVSIIGNLFASFVYPETKRLSELENMLMVLFDIFQLSALLSLTGGLNNPFALLLLGPVCISAAVLNLRYSLILVALAFAIVTLLSQVYVPLQTMDGRLLTISPLFIFGNWIALLIALVFLTVYSRWIANEINVMSDALIATHQALSREQKLHDIGGVVAAAAHELGTPLATIKLTSSELIEELQDAPELAEDAALIRDQADRCRDILRSMGRAGKDDLHLRRAPLSAVLEEAAEPHEDRGKAIIFELPSGEDALPQPEIFRRPEVIHGLRNLVQNAVDFARSTVWVEARWSETTIEVRIIDDGRGFAGHVLGRIGDPFMRKRRSNTDRQVRPGYEGMGLGLFIAKTLLERTGAELDFVNGSPEIGARKSDKRGAIVHVKWPREMLDSQGEAGTKALGDNVLNPIF